MMLNFASVEDEKLASDPTDCQHEDEGCEHQPHWDAVEAAPGRDACEACFWAWDAEFKQWYVETQCRACGEEDYILWQADL